MHARVWWTCYGLAHLEAAPQDRTSIAVRVDVEHLPVPRKAFSLDFERRRIAMPVAA
jgi:hypothetical protein